MLSCTRLKPTIDSGPWLGVPADPTDVEGDHSGKKGIRLRVRQVSRSVAQVTSSIAENFSITRGGALHGLLVRLGQAGDGRRLVLRRALSVVLITWLPLLLLSLMQGLAWGRQINIPFLRDLAINARLLIAAPILILSESRIDRRWRTLVLEFLRTELVTGEVLPSFEQVLERTSRWRDSVCT